MLVWYFCLFSLQDSPKSPHLIVEVLSSDTLEFLISPLSEPSECILHYIITPTSGDGTELPDIVATVVAGQQFAAVNASGFALCNDTYEFTAAAVTLRGMGRRSAVASFSDYGEYCDSCNF